MTNGFAVVDPTTGAMRQRGFAEWLQAYPAADVYAVEGAAAEVLDLPPALRIADFATEYAADPALPGGSQSFCELCLWLLAREVRDVVLEAAGFAWAAYVGRDLGQLVVTALAREERGL